MIMEKKMETTIGFTGLGLGVQDQGLGSLAHRCMAHNVCARGLLENARQIIWESI